MDSGFTMHGAARSSTRRPHAEASGVAFRPDGRALATGGALKLWSVPQLRPVHSPLTGSGAGGLVFLSDGRRLVTGGSFGMVGIDDLAGPQDLRTIQPVRFQDRPLMAVSSDGTTLAVAERRTISFWSTATRKRVRQPLRVRAAALAFDPRGTFLAVGDSAGKLSLWDTSTGKRVGQAISAHTYGVDSIAYRADGRVIASAGSNGGIRLWDERLHPWSKPITLPDAGVWALSRSLPTDESQRAATSVSSVSGPAVAKTVGKPMRPARVPSSLAVSPDGRMLAAGGRFDVHALGSPNPRRARTASVR